MWAARRGGTLGWGKGARRLTPCAGQAARQPRIRSAGGWAWESGGASPLRVLRIAELWGAAEFQNHR